MCVARIDHASLIERVEVRGVIPTRQLGARRMRPITLNMEVKAAHASGLTFDPPNAYATDSDRIGYRFGETLEYFL